jgi:hypothetical protein
MKTKKISLVLTVLVIFTFKSFAQFVEQKEAAIVAKNLFMQRHSLDIPQKREISFKEIIPHSQDKKEIQFYVFNAENAFVIVSAERGAYPVLAYSFTSSLDMDNIPPAVDMYFDNYACEIDEIRSKKIPTHTEIQQAWDSFLINTKTTTTSIKSVSPLLTTTWNQGCFYNSQCPSDPQGQCGYVYTGCVATAMAQVMNYNAFPSTGIGSNIYLPIGGYPTQNVDFSTATYVWDSMPNALTKENVYLAQIMYHAGVSVNMDYSATGSGANSLHAQQALVNHFDYPVYSQYLLKQYFGDAIWTELLQEELYSERAIYYRGNISSGGGGHAFVCDGFQGTDHFHFNWGWGGSADGYYYTNNLNPGSVFTYDQGVIVGLERTDNDQAFCSGQSVYTLPTDTIDDGSLNEKYANNTSCQYLIQPPGAGNITINFLQFNLENIIDNVCIYQGTTTSDPLLANYSGHSIPPEITVWGSAALIVFYTDQINRSGGWKAVYTSSPVAVEENDNKNAYLYPNPAVDKISLFLSKNDKEEYYYQILNMEAKVVKEESFSSSSLTIEMENLDKAMYWIQVFDEENQIVFTEKFVLQ